MVQVDYSTYEQKAKEVGVDLPLEHTPAWARYERALGREPLGHFVWEDRAFIAPVKMTGRGFTYAWAKHGPVWAGEPTADDEQQFRATLAEYLPAGLAFVRLHATHRSADLSELLQTLTFDRTVVLDLTKNEEELMASMKKRGRRDVRKALRNELAFADETDRFDEAFGKAYALLVETGARDKFGIAPENQYRTMMKELGPDHARFYTIRDGQDLLCWGIVTLNEQLATYYYAASSAAGRKAGGPDCLVWSMANDLRSRGVKSFDLMGIDSDRAPQLRGVRDFKTKFSEEIIEVPGAWDYPLRPRFYRALRRALVVKRQLTAVPAKIRDKVTARKS